MAQKNVIYIEHRPAMDRLRTSKTGHVGQYITRQTRQVRFFAHAYAPKPGGPGHGRTRINFAKGELASGITTDVQYSRGEIEGRIIALPKHAIFVHQGTKPHVIRARRAPKLVFFWHRVGRVVSFDKVRHPGQPADDFLWKGVVRVFRRM